MKYFVLFLPVFAFLAGCHSTSLWNSHDPDSIIEVSNGFDLNNGNMYVSRRYFNDGSCYKEDCRERQSTFSKLHRKYDLQPDTLRMQRCIPYETFMTDSDGNVLDNPPPVRQEPPESQFYYILETYDPPPAEVRAMYQKLLELSDTGGDVGGYLDQCRRYWALRCQNTGEFTLVDNPYQDINQALTTGNPKVLMYGILPSDFSSITVNFPSVDTKSLIRFPFVQESVGAIATHPATQARRDELQAAFDRAGIQGEWKIGDFGSMIFYHDCRKFELNMPWLDRNRPVTVWGPNPEGFVFSLSSPRKGDTSVLLRDASPNQYDCDCEKFYHWQIVARTHILSWGNGKNMVWNTWNFEFGDGLNDRAAILRKILQTVQELPPWTIPESASGRH